MAKRRQGGSGKTNSFLSNQQRRNLINEGVTLSKPNSFTGQKGGRAGRERQAAAEDRAIEEALAKMRQKAAAAAPASQKSQAALQKQQPQRSTKEKLKKSTLSAIETLGLDSHRVNHFIDIKRSTGRSVEADIHELAFQLCKKQKVSYGTARILVEDALKQEINRQAEKRK